MNHETSFPRLEVPPQADLQSCPPSTLADATPATDRAAAFGLFTRAARSVWVLPVLKLLGFGCVLTCIAWLGERSREALTYGPEIPRQLPVAVAGEAAPAARLAPAPAAPPAAASPAAAPPPCAPIGEQAPVVAAASAVLPDGRLVLNEASAAELDRLPGIGKKRAEDIVALRVRLGGYRRLTDLLRIRGIGTRSLATLKEHLVLDRPLSPPSADDAVRPRPIPVGTVQSGQFPAAAAPSPRSE